MPFSEDYKALTKKFTLVKKSWFTKVISKFPMKNWTKGGLDTVLKKVKETGSTDRT